MIQTKKALIIALVIPIFSLVAMTAHKKYVLTFGNEITLPITGYDPRDLLSGHFLIYRIDYGVDGICSSSNKSNQQIAFVCLEPKMFSYSPPEGCIKLVRGICNNGQFEAGIEKYFVPEDKATSLEEQVRLKSASIVLSITPSGQAQVKDLLLNGKSWKSQ